MDRKWWTLIVVCVATFMLLLDITIVNVALPEIERSLHADFADLQWVIDAYALTLAALLLTGGSLADILGRRVRVHALALLDPGGRGRRVALRRGERDVLGRAGGIGAQSLPQRGGQLALPGVLPLELWEPRHPS